MDETRYRSLSRRLLGLVAAALLMAVPSPLRAQGVDLSSAGAGAGPSADATEAGLTPFSDVPPDHPAYDAVRRLIAEGYLEGYEDGSFKGRKVITRYDFAVLVAKMLARMEAIRRERDAPPPPEEIMLMDLTREFRQELQLLGIRVDGAERRIEKVDRQTRDLERRKSNLRMEGFYRVGQTFALEPLDTTDYPFAPEFNRFRLVDGAGLSHLNQELYLRFLGTPWVDEKLFSGVEVFAELRGTLSGTTGDTLRYNFTESPRVGDAEDSFATHMTDDQRVDLNRAHLWLRSKRANLRIFANEAVTDLKDPLVLLSGLEYLPFSGLEGEGAHGKFTYVASILRRIEEQRSIGNVGEDLWDLFRSDDDELKDNYALRFTFDPYHGTEQGRDMSLILGFTYNETVWSYDTRYDFNRVMALDGQYDRRYGTAVLESELSLLHSSGRGAMDDMAASLDLSYRNRGLLGTLKAYSFGNRFRAETAKSPFIDTDINFNFRRTPLYEPETDTTGEQLIRLQGKYDVPDRLLESLDDLTLSLLYETKFWDGDPDAIRASDHHRASRFYLQALADITDRTHFEFLTEIQKDLPLSLAEGAAPGHEEGTSRNEFRFDYRLRDNVALVSELAFIDDFDALDAEGNHFSLKRHSVELNSQVRPWLFLKGNTELVNNSDLQLVHYSDEEEAGVPRHLVNGRTIRRFTGEGVLSSKDDVSLRANVLLERVRNEYWPTEDMNRQVLVGELGVNFTRALKARYVHAIDRRDMVRSGDYEHVDDRTWVNGFASIFYRPTETTEFELTWGDEYEDPRDRLDNGSFNFFRSAKIVQLKAQTAF